MSLAPASDLAIALDPRSIAVVGASDNPDKIGGRPLDYLRRFGFAGEVFAVNPKRRKTQGWPTFPSVLELPRAPDVAIVAVPGAAVVEALEACGDAGVRIAILMTAGFAEADPEAGKAAERAMAERARARGMRIVGPNSQGLANFRTGAIASFSTMFIEAPPADGPVGIVSQSGAMSVVPYGLLRARGIGIRHTHATGNDCDVTVAELATAVACDPDLRLLLLYLESIKDCRHLAALGAVARDRDLPVIALKAGRTPAGQKAARSHTGALAAEDRVVDAFLAEHGIWRARSTMEMVAGVELYLKGWRPQGRRLVAISNSGATCVMAADAAEAEGLALEPLSAKTQAELGRILPSFASPVNPVDITAALLSNSRLFSDILPVVATDPAADVFLIGVPVAGRGYDVDAFARDTAAFAEATGKPIVVAAPQPSVAARFAASGLPVFADEAEAIGALARFIGHFERMAAAARRMPAAPAVLRAPARGTRPLNEAEALALLAARGAPVIPHRLCRSADEALAAFADLGGPVALKGCSRAILHKSELGLVRLKLEDRASVADAFGDLRAIIERADRPFEGVIVAAMARGRRELMIGAHRDPMFGPVVLVGDGGKYVEVLPDVQVLFAPFDARRVQDALDHLRIAPLLEGVRDEPPLDREAFAKLAVTVGELILDDAAAIASLDLNPVLVRERKRGCVVLDASAFKQTTGKLA